MISLTGKAVEAVDRFITSVDKPVAGLRIQVEGGGCSGFKYTMKLEEETSETDQHIDCGGVTVVVDENSAQLLEGVTVDFVENLEGSGFKFENPNATGTCGCGNSFTC
ncbi:HesB/IscA family protein [Sessilibacter corallicola]|uniref:HesB/IscA family protein n=1 Tax=Sessilibacter corallicola TaxID=2904075 RepID=UPI001E435283|nr:iron-sulfur cluster assembly accessory protein [Sessilibacter corallicola]MCE2029634.1 iron-sulfur cluster assembly accessory protein [Sessilibacter corallicola]